MTHAHSQLRTRTAGWLLVLAWLGAVPGLLPMFFAALAAAEGSHWVEVELRGEETCVVLTHHQACAMPHDTIHHHGAIARILASVATPDGDGPDHVMHFAREQNVRSDERTTTLVPPEAGETTAPAASFTEVVVLPRPEVARAWPEGAAPRPPAQLAALRGTLLRI